MEHSADDRPVKYDAGGDERENHQKKFARAETPLGDGAEQQPEPGGDGQDARKAGDRLRSGRPGRFLERSVAVEVRLERGDGRCEIGERRLLIRVNLQLLKAL